MITNLEKYKDDLDKLLDKGFMLFNAIQSECFPDEPEKYKKTSKNKPIDKRKLPDFKQEYQSWYSEALLCIKQLLQDRVKDFTELYKSISEYLLKPKILRAGNALEWLNELEFDVSENSTIPTFHQQLRILESVKMRFESSLFDIRQLMQADLFDSEIDSARELNKKGFARGAGAVAGVVLEKHLAQACENHNLTVKTKTPSINDFNQLLKDNDVIDIPTWRFIQRLGDLRNLCDHSKGQEPKKEEIDELIDGVDKITKTLF